MNAWPVDVPVHRVADEAGPGGIKAGDCIIFSERTKHGTLPWLGKGERRTLFYKYVPFGFHHEDTGYDVTDPELTPRQRQLLEFPPSFCNTPDDQYAPYTPLEVHTRCAQLVVWLLCDGGFASITVGGAVPLAH